MVSKAEIWRSIGIASLFILVVFAVEFTAHRIWIAGVIYDSKIIVDSCLSIVDADRQVKCLVSYIEKRNTSAVSGINSYWISILIILIYLVFNRIRDMFKKS